MDTCKNCFYVLSDTGPDLRRTYHCRRYPPAVLAVSGPQGAGLMTSYPIVGEKHWCGEHVAVSESLNGNG